MVRISPFRALRPRPGRAARVASVPYDVVDADEARALAEGNPDSFLHVVRPEIDLPPTIDPHDDAVYAQAAAALRRLVDEGVMERDATPRLYLYRQVMAHTAQVGVVCCCHVEDYEQDRIRKHEHTRRDKEDDRTRHVQAINANAGPVFLTYRDDPAIAALVDRDENARPLYHFVADDGVTHTVWSIEDHASYVAAFADVPAAYVADGHHRSASAARAAAQRRAANPAHRGDEEYNWFLSVLFPASALRILPYNRVILDAGGLDAAAILDRAAAIGRLEPVAEPAPGGTGAFCLYAGAEAGWRRLTLDPATIDASDPVGALDVALVQSRLIEPLFGIADPRTDPRIGFVGGIRGSAALERMVDSGRAALAISMHPTSIHQLMAVADAGRVMPPKSTWFEPKLRSGLFVHELD